MTVAPVCVFGWRHCFNEMTRVQQGPLGITGLISERPTTRSHDRKGGIEPLSPIPRTQSASSMQSRRSRILGVAGDDALKTKILATLSELGGGGTLPALAGG